MVRNGGKRNNDKHLKELIRSEINIGRELKVATLKQTIYPVVGTVSSDVDLHQIMPLIYPGLGDNQRTGGEVILKKLRIEQIVTADFSTGTGSRVSTYLIRDLILRDRAQSGSLLLADDTNFDYNNILEITSPISGTLASYLSPINRNAYAVRQDDRFKVNMSVNAPAWPTGSPLPQGVHSSVKELTFGKNGLKLNFSNNDPLNGTSENFPYFKIVCGAPAQNPVTENIETNVNFQTVCTAYFTDA